MILDVAKSDKIRLIIPYMIATGVVLWFEYGVYYKFNHIGNCSYTPIINYFLSLNQMIPCVWCLRNCGNIRWSKYWMASIKISNELQFYILEWIHITLFVILDNCLLIVC